MLFNSFVFIFAFLPIAYIVFWALRTTTQRYVWLTFTGYVFYGYWDARFCLLMAFSTLVSYCAGLGFLRWSDPRRRKLCLVVPIAIDLALLAFFKYANFGLQSTHDLLHVFGADVRVPHFNIVLPIGISFYTFHTITYIVDSYRGVIRPTRNFFEFSTYVSLFSQLVAGPIVRFRQIEEDLESIAAHDRRRWLQRGVSFFVIGLVEKVLIADSIAAFVDPTTRAIAGRGAACLLSRIHGLAQQHLAKHGPDGGLAVAAAGERRAARPLERDVATASLPVDDLAQKQRAAVAELRRESAELVARVGLGERLSAVRQCVPREERR